MKKGRRWGRAVLLAIAVIFCGAFGYQMVAVRGTFAPSRSASMAKGSPVLEGAAGHRIAGRVYLTGAVNPAAPIVVVLHGDAPFVNPGYQYGFALSLAEAVPGTRVVALLRPGYADPYGARSDGDRGFSSGENYTPEVVGDVAAAIQALRLTLGGSGVVLVGHSGGSAVAADVAALHPGLVQHVFLVSCPCDVPAFRRHMARLQWNPLWLFPVRSLSPMETLDKMQDGTKVMAISGTEDPITLPEFARAYIAKARERGVSASMIEVPGKGHEILSDPAVLDEVAKAVRSE